MALNKKGGFGLDLEEQFKSVDSLESVRPADKHTDADADKHEHTDTDRYADTDTHTDKHTHTHADTDTAIRSKETRSKRLYLLAQPSVHQKLSEYAKNHGDTFNNLVHELMERFIEEKGL